MDLNEYRFPETKGSAISIIKSGPKRRTRQGVPFLKGPVPMDWLREAMKLGGTSLSVGIVLWHFQGVRKSMTFKIGIQDLAYYINRSWPAAQRGIKQLEKNGLVTVERAPGKKLVVTIQDPIKSSDASEKQKAD